MINKRNKSIIIFLFILLIIDSILLIKFINQINEESNFDKDKLVISIESFWYNDSIEIINTRLRIINDNMIDLFIVNITVSFSGSLYKVASFKTVNIRTQTEYLRYLNFNDPTSITTNETDYVFSFSIITNYGKTEFVTFHYFPE